MLNFFCEGATLDGTRLHVKLSVPRAGEVQGSDKLPGQGLSQAERIAIYGVGTGYISYAGNGGDKRAGDQRIKFDKSMVPRR